MTLQEKIKELKPSYLENVHFYVQQEQNSKTDYDRAWNDTAKTLYAGILPHLSNITDKKQMGALINYYEELHQDFLMEKHTMQNLLEKRKSTKNYEKLAVAEAGVQITELFIKQLKAILPQNLKGHKTTTPKRGSRKNMVCVEKMF